MINHPKKYFWLGLVLIFLLGIFGGAYLVLKTTVSYGVDEASTPLSAGKSSDELLAELLKINEQEKSSQSAYVSPEDKNLTEEFSKIILDKATQNGNLNATDITSSDFMTSEVLPYLKSNEIDLFPDIPDSVLKIVPNSTINSQKYYKDTDKDMTVFFNAVKKVMVLDTDRLDENLDDINNISLNMQTSFENLSSINVPKKLIPLHKEVLVSVLSLHKVLESIINSETDPLKSAVIINKFEELGQFWQKTFYDYAGYPESKRSR